MRIVSPLLKHVLYPALSKSGFLQRVSNFGPAVLTYHGILPSAYSARGLALDGHLVTADLFRAHLQFLKSRYNVITPEDFRVWCDGQIVLPPRSVLLTCDDGLLNTVTDMLPIIREFELRFLIFVTVASAEADSTMLWYERLYLWLERAKQVSLQMPWREQAYVAQTVSQRHSLWQELIRKFSALDSKTREAALDDLRTQIGISPGWESEYSQHEPLRRRFFMLNRNDIRGLADAGMTIGAHTLSHPMLSKMAQDLAFREVSDSRALLENVLGRDVWALAYPFGTPEAVTAREAELAQRAGFSCAFMNTEFTSRDDKFRLPRIHVSSGMGVAELEAHLCGAHLFLREKFSISQRPVA